MPQLQQLNIRIIREYDNLPLLAIRLSPAQIVQLRRKLGSSNRLFKDKLIQAPAPVGHAHPLKRSTPTTDLERHQTAFALSLTGLNTSEDSGEDTPPVRQPDNRDAAGNSFNLRGTGIQHLHEQNFQGQGVISVIIDSGVANDSERVPFLANRVMGGENFIDAEGEPSATSTLNAEHGTWVGHLIAASGALLLPSDSPIAQAIHTYRPDAISTLADGQWQIDMTGGAPESSLYAMKVFPASGAGAPASRVIAAMDRVLTLKHNYLDGLASVPVAGDGSSENPFIYDSLNVRILNLSLGGATLFAGQELDELMTEQLLAANILVVTAAGNEGFTGLTTGAPGTGLGALNVGAIGLGANEQVFRELQLGPGAGSLFRPFDDIQVTHFSSRGPSADGRQAIHLLANGVATFVQGSDGHLSMVSGSSFSAPIAAGISASLISMFPDITASQLRNTLALTARADLIARTTPLDQGFGVIDAFTAAQVLAEEDDRFNDDEEADLDWPLFPESVLAQRGDRVSESLRNAGFVIMKEDFEAETTLLPGEVGQFWLDIPPGTSAITISIDEVSPALPADEQNTLFGDDLILEVVDGPTSVDHLRVREFVSESQIFQILEPVPGITRIGLMGDWTNVGAVSTEISVEITPGELQKGQYQASIDSESMHLFEFDADGSDIEIQLDWPTNWAFYPAHDLDFFLLSPSGEEFFEGASFHAPEHVHLELAEAGTWSLLVEGFALHDVSETYQLTVSNRTLRAVNAPPNQLPNPVEDSRNEFE